MGGLASLRYLSLLGNRLLALPPSLGQLQALQTLDVSHNLITALPDEIGALGALVTLELSHNQLRQLPETMGKGARAMGKGVRGNIAYWLKKDFMMNNYCDIK